jgi:hypothetical protein
MNDPRSTYRCGARGGEVQLVEDLVDSYFPLSSMRQRVELCLEDADNHYLSQLTGYLDEHDLEIPER